MSKRMSGGRRFYQKPVADDVDRELGFHLAMREEELVAAGWDRAAARAEAQRVFGDYSGYRPRPTS